MRAIYSTASQRRSFWCPTAATAALGLTILGPTSSAHAQAPPLGTVATFGVLAGQTVTNTGPTVINGTAADPGNVGVSPGAAVVGFPPGILAGPGATFHVADAIALQAQVDLTNAYNTLAPRPATANLPPSSLTSDSVSAAAQTRSACRADRPSARRRSRTTRKAPRQASSSASA